MAYKFEDNYDAADFVKDNLEKITGYERYMIDPNDPDCMLPEQFEKIQAWFEANEDDIEDADFEEFWEENFIDWNECYYMVNGVQVFGPQR